MGNEPKSVKTSYASHDCKKELRRTKELFNSSVCDGSKGEYNGLQTHQATVTQGKSCFLCESHHAVQFKVLKT